MSTAAKQVAHHGDTRRLPYWAFAVVVVIYLAIIQGGDVIARNVAHLSNCWSPDWPHVPFLAGDPRG